MLGAHCPSLYDLRNLFQVNVEEGRHLWAMVYLLHSYFGRDGREEAEALLERRSGNTDSPRMLEAFNEPIDTWLDFFAFTMFTDRDGKSQLLSLSESSLDPLSRTTRFMLTEEAHHMFVGETRHLAHPRAQLSADEGSAASPRTCARSGGIDIPLIQKFVNFWFSQSLDLHGSEVSSNAANYFANGLKGRAEEDKFDDDHVLDGSVYMLDLLDESGRINRAGSADAQRAQRGAARLVCRRLPGRRRSLEQARARSAWRPRSHLPAVAQVQPPDRRLRRPPLRSVGPADDRGGVGAPEERMAAGAGGQGIPAQHPGEPVYKPGQFANYIAPPPRGINRQPLDFEYVRTEAVTAGCAGVLSKKAPVRNRDCHMAFRQNRLHTLPMASR